MTGDNEPKRWIGPLFEVPADFAEPAPHPVESKERFYQAIINGFKRIMRAQGLRFYVHGAENLPERDGALLVINHTGYYDFIIAGIGAHLRGKRLVRFMAKKEVFDTKIVGALMRGMKHVPVDRAAGADSIAEATKWLSGGGLVGIFPESTISRSFELAEFKTGAVRIADEAGVPMIPTVIWGSQRIWTKGIPKNLGRSHTPIMLSYGKPVYTTGDAEEDTRRVKAAMQELLERNRAEYARRFGPFEPGQRWMPAALGGSAPTLEEATAIQQKERAARLAKKQATKQPKKQG
ncbi:lysophospholipid acyltransferase family protein [Corynebacterium sp. MSK041]|uniref:lysophospholipid acyltransferase family protein n=1 Tax=Corynebacterium sp. MSK041 TaxID=3050194 RepID=UPI00254BB438|nr:lysophospholipid acyltransferase family protein [Corynebacterium sp. MSK041]MDK8795977.1 lysophospholipid acyltransferase family protein [Corynebacterium sp. MSK041]